MFKNKFFSIFFVSAIVILFFYGIIELLITRFEAGDIYPAYSSYRSDPLGSKAFYEGLRLLPQVDAARNIEPLSRLSGASGTVLFLFGMDPHSLSVTRKETLRIIEDIARIGGRVIIAFAPTDNKPLSPSEKINAEKEGKEETEEKNADVDKNKEEKEGPYEKEFVDLQKRWLVETAYSNNTDKVATLVASEKALPASLPWHSTLFFKPQDDTWRTVYARGDEPVIIERSYMKGSIVLISDSFMISNEAMKHFRHAGFLAWLCGNHQKIIFDETHLSISRKAGIVSLIRKYGLVPFFMSLIVLALLAVWRQSTGLVPPQKEDERVAVDTGKDSLTGFTSLLRRNISPHEILTACLSEWKRSFTHGARDLSALLPRMEKIIAQDRALPKRKRDPVRTYRALSALRTRK